MPAPARTIARPRRAVDRREANCSVGDADHREAFDPRALGRGEHLGHGPIVRAAIRDDAHEWRAGIERDLLEVGLERRRVGLRHVHGDLRSVLKRGFKQRFEDPPGNGPELSRRRHAP